MKLHAICLLGFVMFLTACAGEQPKNTVPPPASIDNSRIHYDTNLVQPCDALPTLTDPVNLDVLTKAYLLLQGQYADCAIKQHCLAKAVQLLPDKDAAQVAATKCFDEEGSAPVNTGSTNGHRTKP